jgi:prevent-host-death family protein
MQRKVGIREAKAKLSHYVDLARRGEEVILTERGTPVVRLVAIAAQRPSEADVLGELAELGLVDPAAKPPERHRPIRPTYKQSISRLVRELRR